MSPLSNLKIECVESTETYGRFQVDPLERGAGITLGNAMRRVLLGALPGAAVTWVKIEGVEHEFSTIPHMKEDAMDFLLNIKGIRLRAMDSHPGRMVLEVKGKREIRAKDITPNSDFEIANPDVYLATLDATDAKLYVELNIDLGKGYVPAGSSKGLPVGTIPVDAIYTPVRRANYTIESVRTGQETASERLVLEVWTDGTITPAVAVSRSASLLIEQLSVVRDAVKLYPKESEKQPLKLTMPLEQYNKPLEELELSSRTLNALKRSNITTLGQLLERSEDRLPSLRGMGEKSRQEVLDKLSSLGYALPAEAEGKKEGKGKKAAKAEEESEESE